MLDLLNPTLILVIFYTVFICQIGLLSVYYPVRIADRVNYVMDHYPQSDYPNLYPNYTEGQEQRTKRNMAIFKAVNFGIAGLGLFILGAMIGSGYTPDMKGGDEIFVMIFFMLQTLPMIYIQLREVKYYKNMQKQFKNPVRKAGLKARKISDYISPFALITAGGLYLLWLIYFLSEQGAVTTWPIEVFFTVTLITGMNIAYILYCRRMIFGKKIDPYKADKDQHIMVKATVHVMVISSIMISVFLSAVEFADRNNLEVFDPPLISFYLQMCAVMGLGLTLKTMNIKDMQFDVYKDEN